MPALLRHPTGQAPLLCLLSGLLGPAVAQAPSSTAASEIVTSGSGTVFLPPDRAVVRIGVATRAVSASAASVPNGPLVARVQDTLRAIGFTAGALRVISFGVAPNYDYQNARRIIDYEARTTLEVRLQDVPALGRLLDAVLAAGATDISSITFESDSVVLARRRALNEALGAARADAETLAKAAGGRLGPLRLVTTSPETSAIAYRESATMGPIPGSVPAVRRDVVVHTVVQARWTLILPSS